MKARFDRSEDSDDYEEWDDRLFRVLDMSDYLDHR